MVGFFSNLWISFLAGLFAPLGAVCVLPLYPGYLAYLSNKLGKNAHRRTIITLGFVVAAGVITSMLLFGLIFVTFLQASLTNAIGIVSPIAFGILGLVSLLLIFNFDLGKLIPQMHAPVLQNPYFSSFIFGFFFGAIVLPCNPASLVVLFALSTSVVDVVVNLLQFLLFGIGMAFPLVVLSVITGTASNRIIGFLTKYKKQINVVAGVIMLLVSLYYLFFVFRVIG